MRRQDTNKNNNFPAHFVGQVMKDSDKGEKLVSKSADIEYSTKQVDKIHYLSAQNTEF
jgi:hypothetical protein